MSRGSFGSALLLALIAGCGGSPFEGFKEVGHDAHLRYHRLGEGEVLPTDSDSVLLRVRFAVLNDDPGSLLSTERWYAVRDLRSGAMLPVLRRMHEGDSMSVIAPQPQWPWQGLSAGKVKAPPDSAMLQAELAMLRIKTPRQSRAEAEILRLADPEGYERWVLEGHVMRDPREWIRWGTSQMWYDIQGAASDTARAVAGDLVTVRWKGRRLPQGGLFDAQQAFTWRYGEPDQVIAGIQTAVSLLRAGQEGVFIFPSSMAYAGRGIPGMLEPWTPVEYEVSIVAIERAAGNP